MKRYVLLLSCLLLLGATSCKKTRYCRCTMIQNEEVIELGDEFYVLESGTCKDKSKEISGRPQVVCSEVSKYEATGEEDKWWENLFNKP